MGERKLVEVEDGVFVYDPLDYLGIDFNDWSFTVKKKFDKIDRERVDSLKHFNYLGRSKWVKKKAELKSRDLRRWGYRG